MIELQIVPIEQGKCFDIKLGHEFVCQRVLLVNALSCQGAIKRVFKSMGYTITKEEEYPNQGRYVVFEKSGTP